MRFVARDLKGFEIGNHQLRLIVEHLLEVRHEPVFIHRIAMKSAAQLIVHAAFFHRDQRVDDHVESFVVAGALPVAQQEIVHGRPREFGRAAEPAQLRIEGAAELLERACP